MHFAWATALDALPNHQLLITFCDAVLNHPTGGAACRRSSGWVFATVKKHSCSSFEPAFAPFGTKKVEKVRTCIPHELRRLNVTELQIRERLSIAEWHDREGQSCRDRLDRPFRRNFVNRDSDDARDVVSRKRSSEFRIALAHFTEHLTVHSITAGVLGIRSEAHRNFSGFQVESNFGGLLGFRRIQIERCAERRMPGKRQFLLDREDADFLSFPSFHGAIARENESRFRKIHLPRQVL